MGRTRRRLRQEDGRPSAPRADWREWSDILAAAGLPHLGVHSMRHSAATIALDEGVALALVQELLGHSDIPVTRAHTHVSSRLAQDAAARLGRALFGETATKTATRDHDLDLESSVPAGQSGAAYRN